MRLDVVEGGEESFAEEFGGVEVAIVGGVFSSVIPDAFGGVEFGAVGWEAKHFDLSTMGAEKIVDIFFFVVRGVVLDEKNANIFSVKRRQQNGV
jgi:hypothetical protein